MTLEGLSSAKLEPASCKNNNILEINILHATPPPEIGKTGCLIFRFLF